jgi:Derlin-2/3
MPYAEPGNNRRGVGDPAGPDEWFKSLPFVTQYWFGATILVTFSVNMGVFSSYQIMYSWANIRQDFELWRLLTPFCYAGGWGFNMLIQMYTLVSFSKQYETGGPFNTGAGGGTADYAFCILFGIVIILTTYPFLTGRISPVFNRNLCYYVLYVWSKRNPTANASIWIFPIKAIYLPFAYLLLTLSLGENYMDMLHGIAIGHIYYFLVDVIPLVYGKDVLHTPIFLIDYFGVGEYQPEVAAAARPRPGPAPQRGGGGHNWGTGGQQLGAN